MTIADNIRDKKLQYDISRAAAKISALSSGKINKYDYLVGKKVLPPQQHRKAEEAKFNYSWFGKTPEKSKEKTIEDQGEKQVQALESLKPNEQKNTGISTTNVIGWRHISKRFAE